eukprot:NODE_68_length_23780_cov_0.251003.p12 type:complete len:112 gc:universal NODE_68_length_23780_cov_0.251003:15939-15604(-)
MLMLIINRLSTRVSGYSYLKLTLRDYHMRAPTLSDWFSVPVQSLVTGIMIRPQPCVPNTRLLVSEKFTESKYLLKSLDRNKLIVSNLCIEDLNYPMETRFSSNAFSPQLSL